MNEAIGRAIETVNAPVELKSQEAEQEQNDLIAENDDIESEINQAENDMASLKAQLVPNVAAAATELDTNIGRDETPAVAAAAETLDDGNADDTAPVAAGETSVTQDGEWTTITTSDGSEIKTNVGAGGDQVFLTDSNGQEIRVHGDPHVDFNNDGEDDVHTGDNFQIETSGGSIVHFNTVKEGDEWYTRGVFVEDQNGTVTQIGRSANDQDHVAEATEVDESEISQLGSDADGAAVLGIAADGTGMIKQGNDWHVVEDESFGDFKENMSFADQVGEKIDPGFVGADTQGEVLDVAGANANGVDAQIDEGALDIAAQNAAIEQEISTLEGEVQVLNADQSLNDQDIQSAAAEANEARSELAINATLPEGLKTDGLTTTADIDNDADENIPILGHEEVNDEFDVGVIDSDVDADVITDSRRNVNGLGQG